MPEESKENKAKKLAAARKKLKEYQQRGTATGANTVTSYVYGDSSTNSGHVSSNISERSESELQLNGSVNDISSTAITKQSESVNDVHLEAVNYFANEQPLEQSKTPAAEDMVKPAICTDDSYAEDKHNINAIQVLISEKSQLTTELNKFRTLCREKDFELEELRVQHGNASKRVDDLTRRLSELQKQQEQQKLHNAELQHKLAQARAEHEDHSSHINELKQQLSLRDERLKQLDADLNDKCNELELSQLRIRQLSDENSITKDNRVESLTQTQFMYEQQIRDLQAMVQQLSQDKEQANTQYQTYVQQLNVQVQQLTDRNTELTDEAAKLQEREKQCVDHIQQLEKEIQKNISRHAENAQEIEKESSNALNERLKTLQDEFDSERYEFQLKIKSQEDRLNALQDEVQQKDAELDELKNHLENITSEQPDKTKLLATMESDKVAASRALTQNVELKKQLDELETRFVQLTNDKADLMNRLDAEQFANREMYTNYNAMEERLKTIDERFKFKDEEMIRLSHENEELKKKLATRNVLNENNGEELDASDNDKHSQCEHQHDEDKHVHGHSHSHREHQHENDQQHLHDCQTHTNAEQHQNQVEDAEEAVENKSLELQRPVTHNGHTSCSSAELCSTPHIATEEAVEKLQQRFTQLMTQCADLTEEKQRLEHLVMQLQSETETIGEYIALYQTQRRMLKQREYEKAAQTAMLQAEREQMRERLTMLNNLVSSLGMELPQNQELHQHINEALAQNIALNVTNLHKDSNEQQHLSHPCMESAQASDAATSLSSTDSQQILHKIQDIITEIKENTKELPIVQESVDQLNCCSGKFEVV